jgi:hypothetical protein
MNKPELIGLEVNTPDGHRGSILSLHNKGVVIHINRRFPMDVMAGRMYNSYCLHWFYRYDQIEIIKGQYNFNKPVNT